jgi:hypothetical protein
VQYSSWVNVYYINRRVPNVEIRPVGGAIRGYSLPALLLPLVHKATTKMVYTRCTLIVVWLKSRAVHAVRPAVCFEPVTGVSRHVGS